MSHVSQPSCRISARLMGKKGAGRRGRVAGTMDAGVAAGESGAVMIEKRGVGRRSIDGRRVPEAVMP